MLYHPRTKNVMTVGPTVWSRQIQGLMLLVQAVPQRVSGHKDLHYAAEAHNTIETLVYMILFFSQLKTCKHTIFIHASLRLCMYLGS